MRGLGQCGSAALSFPCSGRKSALDDYTLSRAGTSRGPPAEVPHMSRPKQQASELDLAEATKLATQKLADERANVKTQTERLNACIERFESWVTSIPGRVESTIHLPDPTPEAADPRDFELVVRVARDGKEWRVTWGYWELGDDDPILWKPLREASVEIKLYVIPKLPSLILEMAEQQDRLKARIDAVATSFESFAGKVGIPKEGK